jgi:hypothetical protein
VDLGEVWKLAFELFNLVRRIDEIYKDLKGQAETLKDEKQKKELMDAISRRDSTAIRRILFQL